MIQRNKDQAAAALSPLPETPHRREGLTAPGGAKHEAGVGGRGGGAGGAVGGGRKEAPDAGEGEPISFPAWSSSKPACSLI